MVSKTGAGVPVNTAPKERVFEEAGYGCYTIVNDVLGFRCGYVALPEGHPCFGKEDCFDEIYEDIAVNGGVTFAHEREGFWVVDWDAGHAWDSPDPALIAKGNGSAGAIASPVLDLFGDLGNHCWSADEAEQETRSLARQLRAIAEGAK